MTMRLMCLAGASMAGATAVAIPPIGGGDSGHQWRTLQGASCGCQECREWTAAHGGSPGLCESWGLDCSCAICPPGQYDAAGTGCQYCAAGSVTDTLAAAGGTVCNQCSAGQYSVSDWYQTSGVSDWYQTSGCLPCEANHVTNTLIQPGATTCTACSDGTTSPDSTIACASAVPVWDGICIDVGLPEHDVTCGTLLTASNLGETVAERCEWSSGERCEWSLDERCEWSRPSQQLFAQFLCPVSCGLCDTPMLTDPPDPPPLQCNVPEVSCSSFADATSCSAAPMKFTGVTSADVATPDVFVAFSPACMAATAFSLESSFVVSVMLCKRSSTTILRVWAPPVKSWELKVPVNMPCVAAYMVANHVFKHHMYVRVYTAAESRKEFLPQLQWLLLPLWTTPTQAVPWLLRHCRRQSTPSI